MEKRSEEEQSLENEDDSYDGIDVPRYRSFNYDELLSGQAEILEADDDSNQRASESFDCDDLREHQFRSVTIGQHRYEGDDFASTSSLVSNLQPKQSTAGAVGLRAEHFAVSQSKFHILVCFQL